MEEKARLNNILLRECANAMEFTNITIKNNIYSEETEKILNLYEYIIDSLRILIEKESKK